MEINIPTLDSRRKFTSVASSSGMVFLTRNLRGIEPVPARPVLSAAAAVDQKKCAAQKSLLTAHPRLASKKRKRRAAQWRGPQLSALLSERQLDGVANHLCSIHTQCRIAEQDPVQDLIAQPLVGSVHSCRLHCGTERVALQLSLENAPRNQLVLRVVG